MLRSALAALLALASVWEGPVTLPSDDHFNDTFQDFTARMPGMQDTYIQLYCVHTLVFKTWLAAALPLAFEEGAVQPQGACSRRSGGRRCRRAGRFDAMAF